ncbi:MAG: hypothetical protein Ct9H300mP17_03180 [Candidatus Nitrosopelagicus sp.]|nr:MAG: hypothetical protein Ct9H300mP17_03180 [Candidatus Nitrosopelagicus sp.]
MQAAGVKAQWGDDLYPKNLQKIGLSGFYFIVDWPMGPKPFYVKVKKDDPKISESFDLMWGDLELSSGSTRIEKKSELEDRMKNKGMNTKPLITILTYLILACLHMLVVVLVLKD